jgi:putative transposase
MTQRHPVQNNETMFITTNIQNRKPIFNNPAYALEAIETLYRLRMLYHFELFGFVIMPDHCHFLMRVFEPHSISTVMKQFKSGVAFNIGKGPIWQPRFYIRAPEKSYEVLKYIHRNPTKAGIAETVEQYPWSSANERWKVDSIY